MSTPDSNESLKIDALFTILEKHLYDFEDTEESEIAFIDKIVNDYLQFLTSRNVALPARFRGQIVDELRDQVRKMLVKKMYGCLSIEEYVLNQKDRSSKQRVSRKKYSKLW